MARKILQIILIISVCMACSNDPEPRQLNKEDLYGTWVYQSRDGGILEPYTELSLLSGDTWEESQSQVEGDTSAIGGGIWSLEDSTMTVTYIGAFRIERIVKIIEIDQQKLIWERNGRNTTLLAK